MFPTLNPIKSWGCKQLPSNLQPTINFIFLGFQRSIGGGIEQMNPYRPHIQMQQHLHMQVWENLHAERVNQKKCIFCNKDKYIKNSRNRERLSSCMQLLEDEMERKIATQKNDLKILAIIRNELIAKEACYHFTCYRSYTRQNKVNEAKA